MEAERRLNNGPDYVDLLRAKTDIVNSWLTTISTISLPSLSVFYSYSHLAGDISQLDVLYLSHFIFVWQEISVRPRSRQVISLFRFNFILSGATMNKQSHWEIAIIYTPVTMVTRKRQIMANNPSSQIQQFMVNEQNFLVLWKGSTIAILTSFSPSTLPFPGSVRTTYLQTHVSG